MAQKGGRSFEAIIEDFRNNLSSLKKPADLIIPFTYCMSIYSPVRTCIEAGIFRQLASSSKPISASDLSSLATIASDAKNKDDSSAREEFIVRTIRAVVGLNLIDETDKPYVYVANDLTRAMAEPGFAQGFVFIFDTLMGPHSSNYHTYSWGRDNAYTAPTTSIDGPYQQAFDIAGTTSFHHWNRNEDMSNLSAFMKRIQQDRLNWSEWFPANVLFQGEGKDGVFMVDVGGGLGHDLSGMAGRYPDKKMRLILQDQPEVIAEAKEEKDNDSRIEFQDHNFFQPQPVHGASIYFMHKIMHDWPDNDCVTILTHLKKAMAPDSRIFINDAIIPDQGSPLLMAAFDTTMLALLSAKERSEKLWKELISSVGGLEIRNFWQAPGLNGEGIVEVGFSR